MSIKLGYRVNTIMKELSDSSFIIQPLEKKLFKLFVYDIQPTPSNKLITVRVQEIALIPNTRVRLSLESQTNVKHWKDFDTVVVSGKEVEVPLYVSVHNNGYTEASTSLRFSVVVQELKKVDVTVDYYGTTFKGMYTYLSRPVEQTLSRILEIDIIPKDSPYNSYLAYSNGSILLLDNGSGIPYNKEELQ